MAHKNFSIMSAYVSGIKIVFNHIVFFLLSMALGSLICGCAFVIFGATDFFILSKSIPGLLRVHDYAMDCLSGPVRFFQMPFEELRSCFEHLLGYGIGRDVDAQGVVRDITHDPRVMIMNFSWQDFATFILPVIVVVKAMLDLISIGWIKVALALDSKKEVSYSYMYEFYYLVPRVLVVNLVVTLATMAGLCLLIVPGIFVYQRLRFARYFIIDKNLSIVKSLQASWALTQRDVLALFGYSIISHVFNGLSALLPISCAILAPLDRQVETNIYLQLTKGN